MSQYLDQCQQGNREGDSVQQTQVLGSWYFLNLGPWIPDRRKY